MTRDDEQLEFGLVDIHGNRLRADQLLTVARDVVADRGWDRCARELDQIFEPVGHPVSTGTLRNALSNHERNYARLEWMPYLCSLAPEPALIAADAADMVFSARRRLSAEEELELLRERVTREFGAAGARIVSGAGGRRRR